MRYSITPPEASVLAKIDENGLTALHQLSATIRITPGEALGILKGLQSKNFAVLDESDRMVSLTNEGRRVRRLLERQGDVPFSALRMTPREDLVAVAEKENDNAEEALESLTAEALDDALDKALQQLRQQNVGRKE
jgi:DNA-binding MarR family transcriptional regulator